MATIKFTELTQNYDPVQSGIIPFVDISGGNTHYKISQYDLTKKPAFLAEGIGQTITGDVASKVFATSEIFDTHGYYNTGTQIFTPLKSGYYFLYTTAHYNNSIPPATAIYAEIYKNGASIGAGSVVIPTGSERGEMMANVSVLSYANGTGDYFEAYTQHSAAANQTLVAGNTYISFMGHGI